MTIDQYIQLLTHPTQAGAEHVADLDTFIADMPYCDTARMLRLHVLHATHDIRFGSELQKTIIYAPSAKQLHAYINPDDTATEAPRRSESNGDYFDMMDRLQQMSDQSRQSLQELAKKLLDNRTRPTDELPAASTRQSDPEEADTAVLSGHAAAEAPTLMPAREQSEPAPATGQAQDDAPATDPIIATQPTRLPTQQSIGQMIEQAKYQDAIEAIKALHLNNPKKSAYFADQIRFLETARKYALKDGRQN